MKHSAASSDLSMFMNILNMLCISPLISARTARSFARSSKRQHAATVAYLLALEKRKQRGHYSKFSPMYCKCTDVALCIEASSQKMCCLDNASEDSPINIVHFGLSRKHHGYAEPPRNDIVGTPYFIAPEVLRRRYDESCDLWSVGAMAYIMLCGYPPFIGTNNKEIHDSVQRGRY
jgi:serine/threonine protein kinase